MDISSSNETVRSSAKPRRDRWPISPPPSPSSSSDSMQASRPKRSRKRCRRACRSSPSSGLKRDVQNVRRSKVRTNRKLRCNRLSTGPCILRVKNLDKCLDRSDICNMFEHYGPVISVKLHYTRSGLSTGVADVVYMLRKYAFRALRAIRRGVFTIGQTGLKGKIIPWQDVKTSSKK